MAFKSMMIIKIKYFSINNAILHTKNCKFSQNLDLKKSNSWELLNRSVVRKSRQSRDPLVIAVQL